MCGLVLDVVPFLLLPYKIIKFAKTKWSFWTHSHCLLKTLFFPRSLLVVVIISGIHTAWHFFLLLQHSDVNFQILVVHLGIVFGGPSPRMMGRRSRRGPGLEQRLEKHLGISQVHNVGRLPKKTFFLGFSLSPSFLHDDESRIRWKQTTVCLKMSVRSGNSRLYT